MSANKAITDASRARCQACCICKCESCCIKKCCPFYEPECCAATQFLYFGRTPCPKKTVGFYDCQSDGEKPVCSMPPNWASSIKEMASVLTHPPSNDTKDCDLLLVQQIIAISNQLLKNLSKCDSDTKTGAPAIDVGTCCSNEIRGAGCPSNSAENICGPCGAIGMDIMNQVAGLCAACGPTSMGCINQGSGMGAINQAAGMGAMNQGARMSAINQAAGMGAMNQGARMCTMNQGACMCGMNQATGRNSMHRVTEIWEAPGYRSPCCAPNTANSMGGMCGSCSSCGAPNMTGGTTEVCGGMNSPPRISVNNATSTCGAFSSPTSCMSQQSVVCAKCGGTPGPGCPSKCGGSNQFNASSASLTALDRCEAIAKPPSTPSLPSCVPSISVPVDLRYLRIEPMQVSFPLRLDFKTCMPPCPPPPCIEFRPELPERAPCSPPPGPPPPCVKTQHDNQSPSNVTLCPISCPFPPPPCYPQPWITIQAPAPCPKPCPPRPCPRPCPVMKKYCPPKCPQPCKQKNKNKKNKSCPDKQVNYSYQ